MPSGSNLARDDWDHEPPIGAGLESEGVLGPAVKVEDLWLRYRTTFESGTTLKQAMTARKGRTKSARHVEALRGISFEVAAGSVYGVIGHNGAGKSTLFRTIAGILAPTEGRITVAGRVTPLLSLGVGFKSELTGRENILLGGLSTGLHPEEILDRYEDIVNFAELGEALDYPLKTYSSGMSARLGFAVAAHLDPEILLIDEALSAGDARFKKRCTDKLLDLCGRDCTVMIISHGLSLISQVAERAMWLDAGEIRDEGPAEDVVDGYLGSDDLTEYEAAAMEDL